MKTLTRILIASAASLAALQCTPVLAQAEQKPLWSEEDAPATLAFVNPEGEQDPGSSARAEFINPETAEPMAVARSAFGDPDPDGTAGQEGHQYVACKPDGRLHPSQ